MEWNILPLQERRSLYNGMEHFTIAGAPITLQWNVTFYHCRSADHFTMECNILPLQERRSLYNGMEHFTIAGAPITLQWNGTFYHCRSADHFTMEWNILPLQDRRSLYNGMEHFTIAGAPITLQWNVTFYHCRSADHFPADIPGYMCTRSFRPCWYREIRTDESRLRTRSYLIVNKLIRTVLVEYIFIKFKRISEKRSSANLFQKHAVGHNELYWSADPKNCKKGTHYRSKTVCSKFPFLGHTLVILCVNCTVRFPPVLKENLADEWGRLVEMRTQKFNSKEVLWKLKTTSYQDKISDPAREWSLLDISMRRIRLNSHTDSYILHCYLNTHWYLQNNSTMVCTDWKADREQSLHYYLNTHWYLLQNMRIMISADWNANLASLRCIVRLLCSYLVNDVFIY